MKPTLSGLAALAVVTAFATSPASAQFDSQINAMWNNNMSLPNSQKTPEGFATKKPAAKAKALRRVPFESVIHDSRPESR